MLVPSASNPDPGDRSPGIERDREGVTRLLVSCPDQPGILNALSRFLFKRGANIVRSDQHTSAPVGGSFYLRMEFSLPRVEPSSGLLKDFADSVADRFEMTWRMSDAEQVKRCAVLVSRADHCLLDLLWRWQRGELGAEIVLVASNHPDLRQVTESFGLPFHYVPVHRHNQQDAQTRLAHVLRGHCDVVVLARYMQILSAELLAEVAVPVINIHHSFLPAFAGAAPYERAKHRGVKLIGATAHYVTEHLDEGPIIEQDVVRVSHREDVRALRRLGADIERTVLARAVRWHCEDRLIQHDNSVVVF
jgi:formyltetrahydrofolate deformylase